MAWKWFRFLRVATTSTLPTLSEASPAWAQDKKRLNVHDGTQWVEVAYRSDRPVGELFYSFFNETPSDTFPAVKLWDSDKDLSSTNYPLLVPKLRAKKTESWSGTAYVTDHTVTVSSSTLTGSGTAWDNLLAAWAEDILVHGGYTDGWLLNVAGTDYVVTNVNPSAHTVTVTGSPATGTQTAIVYQHRISGSTTTARTYKSSGRVLMSPDGVAYVPGARRRDRMQGHWHQVGSLSGSGTTVVGYTGTSSKERSTGGGASLPDAIAQSVINDGTNGTPRTGSTTDPNMTVGYLYMWAGVYQ